jgi:hypothetical protein
MSDSPLGRGKGRQALGWVIAFLSRNSALKILLDKEAATGRGGWSEGCERPCQQRITDHTTPVALCATSLLI